MLDKKAPDFELPATGGETVRLSDLRGRKVVVYFYPRDNTPGCTQEGKDFSELYPEFQAANTEVLGISRDSVRKHENFKAKYDLRFPLLADESETACRAYDVLRKKKLYGREYIGIDRSTFLIDADGVLRREWRGVKIDGHAEEVLREIQENK